MKSYCIIVIFIWKTITHLAICGPACSLLKLEADNERSSMAFDCIPSGLSYRSPFGLLHKRVLSGTILVDGNADTGAADESNDEGGPPIALLLPPLLGPSPPNGAALGPESSV